MGSILPVVAATKYWNSLGLSGGARRLSVSIFLLRVWLSE
jgi:hypothetical protein